MGVVSRINFMLFCVKKTKNPVLPFKFIFLKVLNKIDPKLANSVAKKIIKPIKIETEFGKMIVPGTYSSFVVVHPSYEKKIREYVKDISKDFDPKKDIFIDIGAHIGRYVVEFSKYFGRILAFEPNPYTFEILKKNVELNDLTDKVLLFNIALSNKDGKIPFQLDLITETECKVVENGQDNAIYVESKKFDDLDLEIDPKNVKLILIDAEGHEYEILEGMENLLENLPKGCRIIIEILKTSKNKDKIMDLLTKHGFKIEPLYEANHVAIKQ